MQTKTDSESLAYYNAVNRVSNDKIFVFHKGIDFLTIRLDTALPLFRTLNGLVENSDTYMLDHGFRIVYFGLIAGSQLKVLHIEDSHSNLVAFIHLKQPSEKKNRNFFTDVEFTGLFWTAYADFFPYFCETFGIDRTKKRIVSRIDYCMDLAGVDVPTLVSYARPDLSKTGHSYHVENETTYRNYRNDRHDMVIYNKRLDVLEKGKHKIEVDGDDSSPYVRYLPSEDAEDNYPITRVEYRLKSRALRDLADSSVDSLMLLVEQMAVDYFARFYHFDLGYVLRQSSEFERHGKPKKIDHLTKKLLRKKLQFHWTMANAYLDNVAKLSTKRKLYRRLYEKFGRDLYEYGEHRYPFSLDDPFVPSPQFTRSEAVKLSQSLFS